MKKKEWNQGLDHIDYDLVEKYTLQKEKIKGRQHTKSVWLRVGALAACLVLIFGAVVFLPRLQNDVPIDVETTPSGELNGSTNDSTIVPPTDGDGFTSIILNATVFPERLSGQSSQVVVESLVSIDGSSVEIPPEPSTFWNFAVSPWLFVVKARVASTYPDEYHDIQAGGNKSPYRLVKMETLETLHGENMPQYFLYLIPTTLYVDVSAYDSLLISMQQRGTENYVLKNVTQNQMVAFDLPIFGDHMDQCDMGRIIAFNDGVFDETLWQNEKWSYGYQFAKQYFDTVKDESFVENIGNLPNEKTIVNRGTTEEEAIANLYIKKENDLTEKAWGELYQRIPTPATLNVQTQEAKKAIEYVKPFANGVFVQTYQSGRANSVGEFSQVVFKRYINGCPTQEKITVNLITGEVTYSEVRYTKEDMEKLENISVHLANMAKEYAEDFPEPPHIDSVGSPFYNTQNKELLQLRLSAWYVKVDGKLYGVIETYWKYKGKGIAGTSYWAYDTEFVLFDMAEGTSTKLDRDVLIKIVGNWNVPAKTCAFFGYAE